MKSKKGIKMNIIKPCPNCKSTNIKDCYVYIRCNTCLMCGPMLNGGLNTGYADHVDHKFAIEKWNNLPREENSKTGVLYNEEE